MLGFFQRYFAGFGVKTIKFLLLILDILILLLSKKGVINMKKKNLFKWKHFQLNIILLTIR
ncbi:hypothetical protein DN395_16670 [Bacillus sp. AR18-7]|nr:hypothetical protein DN395_16670 [Bacillus sp. AR18-7]